MKKLYVLALALVAVFAFAAISVASASATEWLLNGAAITSAISVDNEDVGTLLLQDTGAFTKPEILCSGNGEGTVGPGAADTQTVVNVVSCVVDSGECKKPVVKAIDLPWKTTLELPTASETRDDITEEGKGEPGYETTCETIIGTLHDVCKAPLGSAKFIENNATGPLFEFEVNSPRANCTLGGNGSGVVEGKVQTLALTGTLSVS